MCVSFRPPVLSGAQFEKEALRCSKLLEELDTVVAKKKDVSQQVGRSCVAAVRRCRWGKACAAAVHRSR